MRSLQLDDLTFDAVADLLAPSRADELLAQLDRFASVALMFSAVGSQTPLPLALLAPKNEIIRLGKALVSRLARRSEDFADRARRVEAAHCLIVYTAFFEAASHILTDAQTGIKLTSWEKAFITGEVMRSPPSEPHEQTVVGLAAGAEVLPVPKPFGGLGSQPEIHDLYEQFAAIFRRWVSGLSVWQHGSTALLQQLQAHLDLLPRDAMASYVGQYLDLGRSYPEFIIWGELSHWYGLEATLRSLSTETRGLSDAVAEAAATLDVGLAGVAKIVEIMAATEPRALSPERPTIDSLQRLYDQRVRAPIFAERTEPEAGSPVVMFPTKEDVFIPQAFRTVTAAGVLDAGRGLEDDRVWHELPVQDGLGAYLLGHLQAPGSQAWPLLVLGHPGSGKSLLTEMLAARLATPLFHCVRVPLRDVDPEADIQAQIEHQIYEDTGLRVQWPVFFEELRDAPPVVLFDGLDELLQTTGRVHSNYVDRLRLFREREAVQGRPTRVIVTSRITLIDKVDLPPQTRVLRLEDFGPDRQTQWVRVWNLRNADYFGATGVRPFALPTQTHVAELAKQPLLLMMLALYDSRANELRAATAIDRALLYDSLLRQFIGREWQKRRATAKDDGTQNLGERDAFVETEMRRLGVAALSMFNRRSLYISKDDLDRSLVEFNLTRPPRGGPGRILAESELLLGSFFFIQESSAGGGNRRDGGESIPPVYEFLHNTFGEFLTADFILAQLLTQARTLVALQGDPDLAGVYEAKLSDPERLGEGWFACLMHTALHTRPVIIQMLREWAQPAASRRGVEYEPFIDAITEITRRQLAHTLGGSIPVGELGRARQRFRQTLHEQYATYSLNLVVVRTVLGAGAFVVKDSDTPALDGGPRSWDRLTSLWRTTFTPEGLNGLAGLMSCTRYNDEVHCSAVTEDELDGRSRSRIEALVGASRAIGDGVGGGLARVHGWDVMQDSTVDLNSAARQLELEGIDLGLAILLRRLREAGWPGVGDLDEWTAHVRRCMTGVVSHAHAELLAELSGREAPTRLRQVARRALIEARIGRLAMLPGFFVLPYIALATSLDSGWAWSLVADALRGERLERLVGTPATEELGVAIVRLLPGDKGHQLFALGALRGIVAIRARVSPPCLVAVAAAAHEVGDDHVKEEAIGELVGRAPTEAGSALESRDVRELLWLASHGSRYSGEIILWLHSAFPSEERMTRLAGDVVLRLLRAFIDLDLDVESYATVETLDTWPHGRNEELWIASLAHIAATGALPRRGRGYAFMIGGDQGEGERRLAYLGITARTVTQLSLAGVRAADAAVKSLNDPDALEQWQLLLQRNAIRPPFGG